MGRRSSQTPLPLEAPVRVRLSDDDRARKGHELAVIGLSIRGHKRKLSNDARATKQEIARLEKNRGELEDALIADEELRPQGELFQGNTPTKEEAAVALATVAIAAGEVKPSEPHAFVATGDHGTARQMCKTCGAGATDPVHVPRDTAETSTPGAVSPEESVAAAKEHVTGGNGKGTRTHRTPAAQKARARGKQGKAARP